MRISDRSSDVCSSDLRHAALNPRPFGHSRLPQAHRREFLRLKAKPLGNQGPRIAGHVRNRVVAGNAIPAGKLLVETTEQSYPLLGLTIEGIRQFPGCVVAEVKRQTGRTSWRERGC